jgi:hypothetical protein
MSHKSANAIASPTLWETNVLRPSGTASLGRAAWDIEPAHVHRNRKVAIDLPSHRSIRHVMGRTDAQIFSKGRLDVFEVPLALPEPIEVDGPPHADIQKPFVEVDPLLL